MCSSWIRSMALAGLESCCVSVAVAIYLPVGRHGKPKPLMKDVFYGCVQEIKNGTMFTAERGKGVRIEMSGKEIEMGKWMPMLISESG